MRNQNLEHPTTEILKHLLSFLPGSRLASSSYITNEIHIAYNDDCARDTPEIIRTFTAAMETVIEESEACSGDGLWCSVSDVNVWCGQHFKRRKRDVGGLVVVTVSGEEVEYAQTTVQESVTNAVADENMTTEVDMIGLPVDETTMGEFKTQHAEQTDELVTYVPVTEYYTRQPDDQITLEDTTIDESITFATENETMTTISPTTQNLPEYQPAPSGPTDINITFVITAQMLNKSEEEMTEEDQKYLAFDVLDTLYFYLRDPPSPIVLPLTGEESYLVKEYDGDLPKFNIECTPGEIYHEVLSTDDYFAKCSKCKLVLSFLKI